MATKVKTRENKRSNFDKKILDKKLVYAKNIKDKVMKNSRYYKKEDENVEDNEVNYATDNIVYTGKMASIETAYGIDKTRRYTFNKLKNNRNKKKSEKLESNTQLTDLKLTNYKSKEQSKRNQKLIQIKNIVNSTNMENKSIKSNMNNEVSIKKLKYQIFKNNSSKIIKQNSIGNITKSTNKNTNRIKKVANIFKELAKKVIEVAKSAVALLISGGGLAIIIVIIAVIVAGMFGSAFGLLFSNETPKTEENMSVNSAVNFLDNEVNEAISLIKATTSYDSIRIENRGIVWREVLSVYAVITTNRETKFDIMKMDDHNYDKLKEIFWNVVEIEHYTEKYTVRVVTTDENGNTVVKTKTKTRLIIKVIPMTLDEMMEEYNMNCSERKQVDEMMNNQFDEMWNEILAYYI